MKMLCALLGLIAAATAAPTQNPCVCGQEEYSIDTATTIKSPGFDLGQICQGLTCKYRIYANNAQHVKITFNSFFTLGSLTIYDGPKGDDADLKLATLRHNLNIASMPNIYSSLPKNGGSGVITMVYVSSDGDVDESAIQADDTFGFSLTFTTTADNGCGPSQLTQTLNGPPVSLSTPNYPYNYPPDVVCKWNFTAPSGQLASANFSHDANTEQGYDILVVKNMDNSVAAFYSGQYGHGAQPAFKMLKGSTGGFQLIFTSDDSVDFTGFQASLAGYNPPTNCDCGKTVYYLTDVTQCQTLTSPNFGNGHTGYCENAKCVYNLIVNNEAYKAQISFTSFDLETGYDYLTINDGINGFELEHCTGSVCNPRHSDDNKLTIHFVTDSSISKAGWSAQFCATI